jgi:hypothetical protein
LPLSTTFLCYASDLLGCAGTVHGEGYLLRGGLLVAGVSAIVAALGAWGLVLVVRGSGGSAAVAGCPGADAGVARQRDSTDNRDIGGRAAVAAAARGGGTRYGHIALASDVAGVVVIRGRVGRVLSAMLAWVIPRQAVGQHGRDDLQADGLRSVSDYPGCATGSPLCPLGVDLLRALARHACISRAVTPLGRVVCAGLKRDPGRLPQPGRTSSLGAEAAAEEDG